MTSAASPLFSEIAIVGVGLIGGSIAAAAKQNRLAKNIVGIGRSGERLSAAQQSGLLDAVSVDIAATGSSDFIVVCTPVDRIVADVRAVSSASRGGAIITDVGSVKGTICRSLHNGLRKGTTFVGSHPLAGSEKNGWEHADADLFKDRLCVITPCPGDEKPEVQTVESFWQAIGMRTRRMTPDDHDRALATTSHLPHAVASALASMLSPEIQDFAATGFRDTTRIAAGDPSIWTGIFLQNAGPVAAQIDVLIERLRQLRDAASEQNATALNALLREAKQNRDQLSE
ncbi:MAG: prephenate dehydrogenase [Planctomycetaceae bacterium]